MELIAIVSVVCVCVLARSGRARAEEPPFVLPAGVVLEEGVVYGSGGGRELDLDLFAPEGTGSGRPGILFLHGGGWRGGRRGQFWRQAAHMAARGFVGACAEYRLSGEAPFPAAVEDAKCAVRWLRANAPRYGVDAERIGAAGGSAGGHLAAMLGTAGGVTELEGTGGHGGFSSGVCAVAAFNGVFDLARLAAEEAQPAAEVIAAFLGGTHGEIPETYRLASPIAHVDKHAAAFLLLHGTGDRTIPFEQSEAFEARLREAGVHAELEAYEGAAHGFFNRPPYFDPTLARMEAFFVARLGG